MSFLPNPESVLLNLYQWAGCESQASVIKQRFIAYDMQLIKYKEFLQKLLNGLTAQLELNDKQSELAQSYFLEFANQLDEFNQKIHSFQSTEQQVNWEVLARFHLPQIGRWLGLLCADQKPFIDFSALLPTYDTEKQALILPIELAMNWLLKHYGDSLESLANERCEQFPTAGFKEKESVLRNLYNWKKGNLPDVATIKQYFPDELQLPFVSDEPPTMQQIRQMFLLARMLQAAFIKAHDYFSPACDIRSADLHNNKAYQLLYIGKYIFDLTLFSQKSKDEKQAEEWFAEQLGDYGRTVFAHILPQANRKAEIQFIQAMGLNIPDNFANKTAHFEFLNRYLMSLDGTEALMDFFVSNPSQNLAIQQERMALYQSYKRNAEEFLATALALNPMTAEAFGIFRKPEDVISRCKNLAVIKGLLDGGMFLPHRNISRLLIEQAQRLSQTPDDELFVIKARLHRYLYTDQRRNDKRAAANVTQLLAQAIQHPCAQFLQAQLLNYQARDALSRNDFTAAKQFYRQAIEVSKKGCYGDWRGRIGLDLLALETFDRKLNPNNHETYYRDMLVGGVFNCFIKVDLPNTLEDVVDEMLLDGNHWQMLYQPYYGYPNQGIKMNEDDGKVLQHFFKLITGEPFAEQKVIDWITQHKKVLIKPIPSPEGGNPLMMLLKMISQLKTQHNIANSQQASKMIFAMRRAIILLLTHLPESLNNRDFKQQNPLIFPAEWADFDLIDLMLKQGARPDTLDYQGMTPLHAVIKAHSQACLDLMLSVNPDLSVQTKDGQTLLHTAAKFGNVYAVKTLLRKQPELQNVCDFRGETAKQQAERVLNDDEYWFLINSASTKSFPQTHWQQIVDMLSA